MALSDYTSEMNYARDIATERGMRKGMKKGLQEGRQVGIQEGRAEGLQEGIEAVARNALAQGASLDFVQKITGLDMETIKQLGIKKGSGV